MKRHFDDDLKKLNTELLMMASLTEAAIGKSIEALKQQSNDLARQVIDEDKKIDEFEIRIEQMALELIALHQPMARDLRFITTGLKINAELERIADLTVNIGQRVLEITPYPLLKPLDDIPALSFLARKMVKDAIDAFVHRDETLAKQIIVSDAKSDQIRNKIQHEIIFDYMSMDASCAPRAVPLLLVARHLERICDHATYIAEDIVYMVEAVVVRHHHERLA